MRPAAHRYHSHLNVCSPVIGASRGAAEIAEAKALSLIAANKTYCRVDGQTQSTALIA
jgi:hypothetical protein